MTKAAVLALIAILTLVPLAQGHGAPEPRSIDTRILTDNTQGGDYGEISPAPNPLVANEAVDLLGIDAREAYGPAGDAGVWMRIVYQGGGEGSHRIEISFDLDGNAVNRFFESNDLISWTGDADFVSTAAIPVGDGHPQALEFFLSSNSIGSGTISTLSAVSKLGGGTGDIAPGTYQTIAGLEAVIPGADGATIEFVMDGPDALVALAGPTSTDLQSAANFEITLENLVDEPQFVNFATIAGFGGKVALSPDSIALGPGEVAMISVTTTAPVSGTAAITANSDLGGRAAIIFVYETETIPLADDDGEFGIADLLPPGASYEFTFESAGDNPYHCHPHPFMTGLVTVLEGANPAGATTHNVFIFDNGLQSTEAEMGFLDEMTQTSATTVYEGDTVRWTNTGTHPDFHNVNPGSHDAGTPHGHGTPDEGDKETPAPFAFILVGLALFARGRK